MTFCDLDTDDERPFRSSSSVLSDGMAVAREVCREGPGRSQYVASVGDRTLVIKDGYNSVYSLGLFKYRPDREKVWKLVCSLDKTPSEKE
jgi:hypothetical protein